MPQLFADTLLFVPDSLSETTLVVQPQKSLFMGHELVVEHGLSVAERDVADSGFIFVMLLVCVAIMAYLQLNSDRLFSSIFKASFDRNLASQEARIENSQRVRNLFIVQVVAFLSISLFITGSLVIVFNVEASYSLLFLQVLGGLLAFHLAKRLIFGLLTLLFEMDQVAKLHRYDLTVLLSSLGLLLLPISLVFFYSPALSHLIPYYLGLGIIAVFYLKGIIRGLQLTLGSAAVSPLLLFYYFCALEILPAFILVRMVQML